MNSEDVLQANLLRSPDARAAAETLFQSGYASAAAAYNAALDSATTDVVVLAHQDVYLPAGWLRRLEETLLVLSETDPAWGVLGVWGNTRSGHRAGHVYCCGLKKELGVDFDTNIEVMTLDELMLIVRKSSGLRFDPALRGFHLYGADICLEAGKQGLKCYAIPAFCIHNTNGYNLLPLEFWRGYLYLRKKWSSTLPIRTTCTKITWSCWPMLWWNVDRIANLMLGRHRPGKRLADPRAIDAHGAAC